MSHLQRISHTFGIIILLTAIFCLSRIGYGDGHIAMLRNTHVIGNTPPSQLSVIYERTYLGKCDFLHLKIDTTYHAKGKNGYCYEVTCNHTVSLRSFDTEYTTLDITPDKCFTDVATNKLLKTNDIKQILGYSCYNTTIIKDNISWEAWYSDELPHIQNIPHLNSRYKGFILAACNAAKSYTLKARYIEHKII